jgi:hypothetical protein
VPSIIGRIFYEEISTSINPLVSAGLDGDGGSQVLILEWDAE